MLDIQNIGLVELNALEAQEVEGGIIPVLILVGLFLWGEYYQSSHGMGGYGNP